LQKLDRRASLAMTPFSDFLRVHQILFSRKRLKADAKQPVEAEEACSDLVGARGNRNAGI
jgi:hypothetical protein